MRKIQCVLILASICAACGPSESQTRWDQERADYERKNKHHFSLYNSPLSEPPELESSERPNSVGDFMKGSLCLLGLGALIFYISRLPRGPKTHGYDPNCTSCQLDSKIKMDTYREGRETKRRQGAMQERLQEFEEKERIAAKYRRPPPLTERQQLGQCGCKRCQSKLDELNDNDD